MKTRQTGDGLRKTAARCKTSDCGGAAGQVVDAAETSASDAYFFCEVGHHLYAIMLFPLENEVVRVILSLGRSDGGDEDAVDVSTAVALLEMNSGSERKRGPVEKKTRTVPELKRVEEGSAVVSVGGAEAARRAETALTVTGFYLRAEGSLGGAQGRWSKGRRRNSTRCSQPSARRGRPRRHGEILNACDRSPAVLLQRRGP